jgi:hypothetical protein
MNKAMYSKSLLVRFVISALMIGPCLFVPQAAFAQYTDQPKNPGVLIPHETIVDEKDKDKDQPAIPLLKCGKCPEGFVKTAVAVPRQGLEQGAKFDLSEICQGLFKSEDTTVVECKPIGKQNQMPVCGTCPEGYLEIGRSLLPALCGNEDGGLRTQCQLPKMEGGMPDPTQGGRKCPPDCVGNLPTPGQGSLPSPPKVPSVEIRKIRPEESP